MSRARYRVTDRGRLAWEKKDPAVPSDYRMILWLIDFHGDRQLETWIQNFPDQRLEDCLGELLELGLLERESAATPSPLTTPPKVVALRAGELARVQSSLAEHGAYVSAERLRPRPAKPAGETVVLLVEDDPDQRALADLRLSMAGYSVRVAESQAALLHSLAKQGMPDLLLLDVGLPDGDGFEILERLRRLPSFSALPIVMLTVKKTPSDIERGLTLGADGYVTKPYSKSILAAVVKRVLEGAPG